MGGKANLPPPILKCPEPISRLYTSTSKPPQLFGIMRLACWMYRMSFSYLALSIFTPKPATVRLKPSNLPRRLPAISRMSLPVALAETVPTVMATVPSMPTPGAKSSDILPGPGSSKTRKASVTTSLFGQIGIFSAILKPRRKASKSIPSAPMLRLSTAAWTAPGPHESAFQSQSIFFFHAILTRASSAVRRSSYITVFHSRTSAGPTFSSI